MNDKNENAEITRPEFYDEVIEFHFNKFKAELEQMDQDELRKYHQEFAISHDFKKDRDAIADLQEVIIFIEDLRIAEAPNHQI